MQDSVESKGSLYDTIQKIGCYDQTEFYSNFLSCWKCKDNINACGSLWQKKFYTFWQFRRNSIDLFLGPSFFFLVFFINRIQKIGCCDYSKFYSNFVSCGSTKMTLINVCHYGRKSFSQFGSFGEIPQIFSQVRILYIYIYIIESNRQVAMTRLSFIVILCRVGSAKMTLMHVGDYG